MEQAGILVEEIKESAEKRGEMILKNAESGAESIIREAKEEALRLSEENRTLWMCNHPPWRTVRLAAF